MNCPCKDCTDRTLTCHGVCKKYEDWKIERAAVMDWIREKNMNEISDSALKRYWKNLTTRRRRALNTHKEV